MNTSPSDVSPPHQPAISHPARATGGDPQTHKHEVGTDAGVDLLPPPAAVDQGPDASEKGLIIYPGDDPGVECEIRELTSAGAKLRLGDDITVPSCFQFSVLPDGALKQAQVCWRGDREIGVRFINND